MTNRSSNVLVPGLTKLEGIVEIFCNDQLRLSCESFLKIKGERDEAVL